MSIIKSIKQILGLHPAAENHFWDGSVPNELTLKRGTPEVPGATVMQVVDGKVAALASAQTWQDMTVSRVIGTTYTNNTGMPINVAVILSSSGGLNIGAEFIVGAISTDNVFDGTAGPSAIGFSLQGVVPAGATYKVDNYSDALNLTKWYELRN